MSLTPFRDWWMRWRKPAITAHLICCGAVLIWAAAFFSGFTAIGGAFLEPMAYAAGVLILGTVIWVVTLVAGRRREAEDSENPLGSPD